MVNGRLTVDKYLNVPGHPEVFSCGDIAAVPDLTRPGQITGMTAQHAVRQGKLAARNITASLGLGTKRAYWTRRTVSWWTWPGSRRPPIRSGCRSPDGLRRPVTRGYHRRCQLTVCGWPAIGSSTPYCPASQCSSGWCGAVPCRSARPTRAHPATSPPYRAVRHDPGQLPGAFASLTLARPRHRRRGEIRSIPRRRRRAWLLFPVGSPVAGRCFIRWPLPRPPSGYGPPILGELPAPGSGAARGGRGWLSLPRTGSAWRH